MVQLRLFFQNHASGLTFMHPVDTPDCMYHILLAAKHKLAWLSVGDQQGVEVAGMNHTAPLEFT